MKKTLLTLAIGAMALTACTSQDVIKEGVQSNTIQFKNVVNKDARALDNSNFGLFYVYGFYTKGADLNTRFQIFTDTEVTKDPDGGWTSSISRYWVDGATYSFYAYSCENKHVAPEYGGPSLGLNDGQFLLNYTCHTDGGASHDLLFASATGVVGKESGNEPVNLKFQHILSKLDLNFISEFPDGYQVEISNVSIESFKNEGTFKANKTNVSDGTLGSWSDVTYDPQSPNRFSLNTVGNNVTTLNGAPVVTAGCHMIPFHYKDADNPVKIQFNIKVINPALDAGSQTILSNTLTGTWKPNWRAGTYYTYKIRLSGGAAGMEAIKFGVSVTDWNNPKDDNIPEDITISLDYHLSSASDNPAPDEVK